MSVISSTELINRAGGVVLDRTFEAALLNVGLNTVTANSDYSTLIQYEVASTSGGYARLEFTFDTSNILETSTGASTDARYLNWIHNGNSESIEFDTILILEKEFAQPTPNYYVVALHSLGLSHTLIAAGDRARFALRFNVKDK